VLHEDLIAQLNRSPAPDEVVGLVFLNEQLDLPALEREMAARDMRTRWRRHAFVIRSARELAQRSQGALLAELGALAARGEVSSFTPYWICNLIVVRAAPEAFLALSQREDVGMIYPSYPVTLRGGPPEPGPAGEGRSEGGGESRILPDALAAVNVQPAWDLGYRGAGTLVCDFDTGADGNHPALAARWRGLQPGVSWDEAWYDPYGGTEFPYDAASHGTHTLGIMVATPPVGSPIGVAPQAQWIAAGVLIGWDVQKIIASYQWAADPDGDPETLDDVPDVINNSWGTSANCDSTFWGAIDVVEAAGVINVIAVDNSGPATGSVNSPESRAESPTVNFSVGNIDPHQAGYPIYWSSGRGPSPCDGVSIKPEVTAPGTLIYSTIPGGGYGNATGTSAACPHVSGAAALLRQVNPSLTVTQVKQVLMDTATDLGTTGEDNTYGWGLINIGAAVNYVREELPPSPPPRSLAGTALPDSGVSLRWLHPDGTVPGNLYTSYRIYRAAGEDPFPDSALVAVDTLYTGYFDTLTVLGSYRYVVTALYENAAESEPSNEITVDVVDPASVAEAGARAAMPRLSARPNPFGAWTEIRWSASAALPAVSIYDAAGRRVRTLEPRTPGERAQVLWDGQDDRGRPLPAGIYFACAREGARTVSLPVAILR